MVMGTTYTPSSRMYAAVDIPQMTHRKSGAFYLSDSSNIFLIFRRLFYALSI